MGFFLTWLTMASIQAAATISPGPAFAMTVRNSMAYNRRAGIFSSLGLAAGVAFLVSMVLGGLAVILTQSVLLYNIIKYAGAAYLVYIGVKSIRTRKKNAQEVAHSYRPAKKPISDFKAFQTGLFTNMLNPKGVVFFTAFFTQFVDPHTPVLMLVLYGSTSVVFEFLWFSCVTVFLTNPRVEAKFLNISHWIERVCGALLMAIGVKIALSKA